MRKTARINGMSWPLVVIKVAKDSEQEFGERAVLQMRSALLQRGLRSKSSPDALGRRSQPQFLDSQSPLRHAGYWKSLFRQATFYEVEVSRRGVLKLDGEYRSVQTRSEPSFVHELTLSDYIVAVAGDIKRRPS
jgi:hypothetical protein